MRFAAAAGRSTFSVACPADCAPAPSFVAFALATLIELLAPNAAPASARTIVPTVIVRRIAIRLLITALPWMCAADAYAASAVPERDVGGCVRTWDRRA